MFVNQENISLESLNIKNLNGLLTWLKLDSKRVVVEVNGNIIENFDVFEIKESDVIEIIHYAGGG